MTSNRWHASCGWYGIDRGGHRDAKRRLIVTHPRWLLWMWVCGQAVISSSSGLDRLESFDRSNGRVLVRIRRILAVSGRGVEQNSQRMRPSWRLSYTEGNGSSYFFPDRSYASRAIIIGELSWESAGS